MLDVSAQGAIFGGGAMLLGLYHAVWPGHAAWLNASVKSWGLRSTSGEIEPTPAYVRLNMLLGIGLLLGGAVALFAL